jgi:hypothetical protein
VIIQVSGEEGSKYWPSTDIFHAVRFKHKPTNREMYAALDDSLEGVGWRFEGESGWPIISCGVCEQNWLTVTGERPTRFFSR